MLPQNVPMVSSRGFTLYTALLSFVLILLAGLLVNTMINSEKISNQVILEVEAQSRMQSLADLTRADALQVVNYGIRNAIEAYTQDTGNSYPYTAGTLDWDQVKNDFSRFFFGGPDSSSLATRIASNLYVIVQSQPRQISGYTISVKGGTQPQLTNAIREVLFKNSGAGTDFLQVVNCPIDKGPEFCVGTFYVNLDFSILDDATYETLPSIHVYDSTTGRELVEPVIPRGKFRIYVPLRIFRALRYAHDIAKGPIGTAGLLSDEFHDNLGLLGVGMCDSVDTSATPSVENCAYRTFPFTPASPSFVGPEPPLSPIQGGNLCPADNAPIGAFESLLPQNVPLNCDVKAAALGLCAMGGPAIYHYDPSDALDRAKALNKLVEGIITNQVTVSLVCDPASPTPNCISETPDFKILTNNLQITPKVQGFPSKQIEVAGIDADPSTAYCTKLTDTDVTLLFEESNENYIVVDSRNPLTYSVHVVDSFLKDQVVNPTLPVCVSYCLKEYTLGDFIFGPDLAGVPGLCNKTACAYPGKFENAPACGNGVQDPNEECDSDNVFGKTCADIPGFMGTAIPTCNNNTCTFNPGPCTPALVCGNNFTEPGNPDVVEQCDGTDVANCVTPTTACGAPGTSQQCQCIPPPGPTP